MFSIKKVFTGVTQMVGNPHRERGVLDLCDTEENRALFAKARLRISPERGLLLKEFLRYGLSVPGDVVEMGVYKGGSAYVLAATMRQALSAKKLYLFDTFEGTPDNQSRQDNHLRSGQYNDTSVDEVMRLLGDFKDMVVPVEGMIPASLGPYSFAEWAFVHVHLNLYQSTKDALQYVYPRISPAGILFIEDYGLISCAGVKEAVDEFCMRNGGTVISLPSGQGVIIKNEY